MTKQTVKKLLIVLFTLLGASIGFFSLPMLFHYLSINNDVLTNPIFNILLGAVVFFILALVFIPRIFQLISYIENFLSKKSPMYLLFASVGSIIGLIIGGLLSNIFNFIPLPGITNIFPIIIILLFAYIGFYVGTTRIDEWRKVIQFKTKKSDSELLVRRESDHFRQYKILDTSVIIDGRIYDVAKIGFIEGTLVIPTFVLHELQYIADSSDTLKRAKGRRGLDILNALQKLETIAIENYEGDFEDIAEVDSKLVKLAKILDGVVVTNDYNLSKVCEFQNVAVMNLNALSTALKQVVLPGEVMNVLIVKDGTERQQGIAYLDDGTMIVVEDGHYYINQHIDIVVTSALQTAAGRMIFAKLVHSQKKINE